MLSTSETDIQSEVIGVTDFVSTWNEESFLTTPVGPLGLIAMRGTEEIAGKVNQWLL